MLSIWFGIFFVFRKTSLEKQLSEKERQLYLNTIWIYPLVETSLKWMIEKNVIPYSWFWLNRLEHFSWAIAVGIIFLPAYADISKKLKWWQNLILVTSLVCLLGNLNEFLEYFVRVKANLTDDKHFAVYYWDTIYDMMMNMMGGFVGFLVLTWNAKLR